VGRKLSYRGKWVTGRGPAAIAQLSWEVPSNTRVGDYRITHIGFDDAGDAFSGVSEAETGKSGVVGLPIRLQHYPRP
jgi:hypothetical protein